MTAGVLEETQSKSIAYCEHCRKERQVHLVEETETLEIDGISYSYTIHTGYCSLCGEKATPQVILEANQRSFSDAVRRHHGIVSQETVEGLPVRYNIRPRPLSALLGWGEHTYSRFIEGDIPSKVFADRIQDLYDSPLSFYLLLLNSRDNLTGVALRKAVKATKNALASVSPKVERVCAYLIGKTESNSSLALQKELYYAQGMMLAFFGRTLFDAKCEAWQMGPVFPEVWRRIHPRDVSEESLQGTDLADCVRGTFTDDELTVLDAVVARVGCYSPFALRDITHNETPWKDARGDTPADEASNNPIDVSDIGAFFMQLKQDYGMERPSDIGEYLIKMVEKV